MFQRINTSIYLFKFFLLISTEYLLSCKFPIAALNSDLTGRQIPSVTCDHVRGYSNAWHYVEKLGHRQAAFLGFLHRNESRRFECGAGRELAQSSVSLVPLMLPSGDGDPGEIRRFLLENLGPYAPGRWPTLFFTQTDLLAMNLIKALEAWNIQVPTQVSVIGFNDMIARTAEPQLTTLAKPRRRMAVATAYLLGDLLSGRPGVQEHLQVFPLTIVERETCAAAPVS